MENLPPLPMDLGELREVARKLAFIIEEDKLDRLQRVFQERTAGTPAYHDGERYHEYKTSPIREEEQRLWRARRDNDLEYHPLVKALVELLKVPKEQAIAVVAELEFHGYRRAMLDLIDEAHKKLSRPRRAS